MTTVRLTDQQSKLLESILERLSLLHTESRSFGRKFAKECVESAIWKVMEANGDANSIASDAVSVVASKFEVPFYQWEVFLPVTGIEQLGTSSWKFGNIAIISTEGATFKRKTHKGLSTGFIRIGGFPNKYFASVKVTAIDQESAISLAHHVVEFHVSVLNALACLGGVAKRDRLGSSYGNFGEVLNSWILCGRDGKFGGKGSQTIPLAGLHPHLLKSSTLMADLHPRILEREIKNGTNDFYAKRIFPALKWLGKGIMRSSPEEKFLYYFLAMESLVFEEDFRGQVVVELKRRISTILFFKRSYLMDAAEAFTKFDHLYELRSSIVHRGGTEITQSDIELAHDLVLGVVYKMMNHHFFRTMETSDAFESWISSEYLKSDQK